MSAFDPVKCEKCGNDDQGKMICEPSLPIRIGSGRSRKEIVHLVGYRCAECGHVTKLRDNN